MKSISWSLTITNHLAYVYFSVYSRLSFLSIESNWLIDMIRWTHASKIYAAANGNTTFDLLLTVDNYLLSLTEVCQHQQKWRTMNNCVEPSSSLTSSFYAATLTSTRSLHIAHTNVFTRIVNVIACAVNSYGFRTRMWNNIRTNEFRWLASRDNLCDNHDGIGQFAFIVRANALILMFILFKT